MGYQEEQTGIGAIQGGVERKIERKSRFDFRGEAAEAEYKAARADKDALAARTEARKLADASGLKDDGVLPVQPTAAMTFGANRLYPANAVPSSAPAATTTSLDLAKTRIQQADFNAPQKEDQDLTKANVDGTNTPLRPAAAEQPAQQVQ